MPSTRAKGAERFTTKPNTDIFGLIKYCYFPICEVDTNFCASCSMPLANKLFIGMKIGDDLFCTYCIDENQQIKSCKEIFQGGVHYFVNNAKLTKDMAEKITRTTMSSLHFWKGSSFPCLKGEMLTDAEIREIFPSSKEI